jgi:hypothetical protein
MAYIGNPIYQSAFVTDQFSGDGTTTAFTMSVSPAGVSNVLVAVSGVLQDPSTYGVVGTTINFSTAPPSGTGNISCRYLGVPVTGVTTTAYRTVTEFTATASQTTFTPPSYTVGFINVYRNGVLLGSADYTASNGTTVVLATGATVGDLVTVESFQVSSVVNAIQNTAGSVSSTNLAGDAVTTAKIADGAITTAKIATGAVITADLADGAVTRAKMGYAGAILQVVSTAKTDTFTTTGTSFVEVTGLSVSITPTSTSSRILIIAGVSLGATAGAYAAMPRLARNGTGIFVSDAAGSRIRAAAMFEVGNAATFPVAINFLDSPSTTSATTYSVQLMSNTSGQPARVNASASDTDTSNWSRSVSSITVMEIAG